MTPELALTRVYEDLRKQAVEQYGQEVADTYAAARQDMNVSGYGAAAAILDDLNISQHLSSLDNGYELADITTEATMLRDNNPGRSGKELANALYNICTERVGSRKYNCKMQDYSEKTQ